MAQRWILATGNAGKLRELRARLETYQVSLISQAELGIESPPETGRTFRDNALIKARHAARHGGLPALADDSGLAVDALGGQPGVHSARYAGPQASDDNNVDKLLREMDLAGDRKAQFCCVLAWVSSADDRHPLIFEGRWDGEILRHRRGQHGFGYDPVFLVPALQQSAAELDLETKNRISHRALALDQLLNALRRGELGAGRAPGP